LTGDFFFDQTTRANGTRITRLAMANLNLTGLPGDTQALKNAAAG